jgi:hypothetical protein
VDATELGIGQPDVQLLLRRMVVREVIERYALALDGRDLPALEACFDPQAIFVVSAAARFDVASVEDSVVGPGWPAIRALLESVFARFRTTTHFLGQSSIETAGTSARSETYAVSFGAAVDGDSVVMRSVRYLDELRLGGGAWRILHRRIALDWSTELEPSAVVSFGRRVGARATSVGTAVGITQPDRVEGT